MARISQKTIDLIKDTADIVDVVSEFVPLQAAGKNMKGLCPFHSEKTPSFFVSKERQLFNCFGCGKKGSAVTFIQEYKNISYVDALKFLADKYHIDLELDESDLPGRSSVSLYKANEKALEIYSLNLLNIESGRPALDYLLKRGLTLDIIKEFELGFATNKNNDLFNQLSKDYQPLDLINAGLINRGDQEEYYDLFRSRIMFPIRDETNRVVAFSGRIFNDSMNQAKYVNTAYTEIFSKSHVLYNLYRALPHIRTTGRIVLMEGYMDVIKANMAGVKEAVCSMGTQLTIDQALLIKKYTDNIVICYDGDKPGQEATYKAIKILENAKLNVKVVSLPEGMDPDEYITKNNDFQDYLDNNQLDQFEFVYKMIVAQRNLHVPAQSEQAKNLLFDFFSKTSGMIREIYLKRFASETGITYQTLLGDYHQTLVNEKIVQDQQMKISQAGLKKITKPKYETAEKAVLNYYLKSAEYRQIIDDHFANIRFKNLDIRSLIFSAREKIKPWNTNPLVVLKIDITNDAKEKLEGFIREDYEYNLQDLESCIRMLKAQKINEEISDLVEKAAQLDKIKQIEEYLKINEEIKYLQGNIMELEGRKNGPKTNY